MSHPIPVIDVFAGCGGLGEGFSALKINGTFPFDVRLSIEKEYAPIKTLQLRSFFHQFRGAERPESYYQYVRGDISRDDMFKGYPSEKKEAFLRCLQAELGNTESSTIIKKRISKATAGHEKWVLIGGPPCQAYSTIGRSKNNSLDHYDPEEDVRFELYLEYLKIICTHWPAVFVMENVKGLLSASRQNRQIFAQMCEDLANPANAVGSNVRGHRYNLHPVSAINPSLGGIGRPIDPTEFVVKSELFGIPQARHRVVILGIRDDVHKQPKPLVPHEDLISAVKVLEGLPRVRSGLSTQDSPEEWVLSVNEITCQTWWNDISRNVQSKIRQALEGLQEPACARGDVRFLEGPVSCKYRPDWFLDPLLQGTLNHEARTHRKDDLWRYLYAACFRQTSDKPFRISDFPTGLKPNHENVKEESSSYKFTDRFSVQPKDKPSRTVVNHIRKDGHYYIHYDPTQCRSLTVREAARLQTFPDNYFFEGSKTDQYGQVGNAVPPLLSYQIAQQVAELLNGHDKS